jgi:hypothetical protein
MEQPTLNMRCPFFEKIGLHAEAQPTWFDNCAWSHVDPEQTNATSISVPSLCLLIGIYELRRAPFTKALAAWFAASA